MNNEKAIMQGRTDYYNDIFEHNLELWPTILAYYEINLVKVKTKNHAKYIINNNFVQKL